jgi:DNA-binding NtrC family response regulator
MSELVSAGECDVVILDLDSNHELLEARVAFSRRLIASTPPAGVMAGDGLRSTAFELVRTGAFGYCRRPPSIRDLKTMLSRAYENSLLKRQLETVQQRMEDPCECDQLIGSSTASPI